MLKNINLYIYNILIRYIKFLDSEQIYSICEDMWSLSPLIKKKNKKNNTFTVQ